MARFFNSTSLQYLIGTGIPVVNPPLSFSCKFRLSATAPVNKVLICLANNTGQGRNQILVNGTNVTFQRVEDTGANTSGMFSSPNTAGVWYDVCGTMDVSGGLISTWVDGVIGGTNVINPGTAQTINPATASTIIGMRITGGNPGLYFDGEIAEVGMWNAILTPDEIRSLARGFTPPRIRPRNLVFYAPLLTGLNDMCGGMVLSNVNNTSVTEHPRRIG